ncbi:HTTM domain-containing protein [Populibacterium corticicola]|uniref:HTTM domain-containing protein n=1 Tax=Populibacterium corticicola TaxID=1812826 RepID=A0ABW5XHC9_9MICO
MWSSISRSISTLWNWIICWFIAPARNTRGTSFLRIMLGGTLAVQLIVNFPFRSYMWGPAAAWSQELHASSEFPFQRLIFGPTSDIFFMTFFYIILLLAAISLAVGWHTRIATLIALILHTSLVYSDGVYMDQSDNLLRMALIYMLFMRCSEFWSLDSRRTSRNLTDRTRFASSRYSGYFSILHNASLAAFGAHLCLIYAASAMFKVQGDKWQNGTAVFYPLQLPHYAPFPELNALVSSNGIAVMTASYAAVYFQLFFPFMLLHRVLRKVALLGVVGMHLGIAVLMGLPFFSFFMLAGDSIFVSDRTYTTVDSWVRSQWTNWRGRKDIVPIRTAPRQIEEPSTPLKLTPSREPTNAQS